MTATGAAEPQWTATASTSAALAQRAFIWACTLDIRVLKPGNVSLAAPGHGMTADQFLASAAAAAPALCAPGSAVGNRILAAVDATQAVVNCNTNLGIVLLCAPIAAAFEAAGETRDEARLRLALKHVLAGLTVTDARAAFRGIALANPGGLGTVPSQDVRDEPTLDLVSAMRLARDRDLIAQQYATDYAALFEVGIAAFDAAVDHEASARARDADASRDSGAQIGYALQCVFLAFLSRYPDSHIVRKQGLAVAQSVKRQARHWRTRLLADRGAAQAGLARWDAALKARRLNPGTSADLSVATAFTAALLCPPLAQTTTA